MAMGILGRSWVLSLVLIVSPVFAQALPSRSPAAENSRAIPPDAWRIVLLANKARAAAGVRPLKWDPALAEAARRHCLRMAAEGPLSHQYAGEPDVAERANQAGARFSMIEENVAFGPDPATVHDEWMHSPGHRANLLNPYVDRIGVAVLASRGEIYAVADYERTVIEMDQNQVEAVVAGRLRSSGVKVLEDAALARAACATDQGLPRPKSSPRPRFVMRWLDAELTQLPQALVEKLATGQFHAATVGSCPTQGEEGSFKAFRIAVLLY
jgi:hypothetical protein